MINFFDDFEKNLKDKLDNITLTAELIERLPKIDLHVHLPGTISPKTAWKLGLRNKFITVEDGKWYNGPKSLDIMDPHEHYSDIFKDIENASMDEDSIPVNLTYDIAPKNFKSFDMVMATVQGHRYPPGGIKNEDDLQLVLRSYLNDCVKQNIFYTELQQNIRIAYHLYPELTHDKARQRLYYFLEQEVKAFALNGVHLRFLHCFNKTRAAGVDQSTDVRSLEAAAWLQESREAAPGLFVGLESAGHEKDESGWPIHLKAGYEAAESMGFGCEAHGGEGIGVEHLMDVVRILPVTRIAHGFQIIESLDAIEEIKKTSIALLMSPIINLSLGGCIHYCSKKNLPKSHSYGGEKKYISNLTEHPLFTLLREHKMKVSICSDNPEIAGVPIEQLFKMLVGIKIDNPNIPSNWIECKNPLKLGELILCLLNGIDVAFCEGDIKQAYLLKLQEFLESIF